MSIKFIAAVAILAAAVAAVTCPACDQTVCNTALCGAADPYYCSAGQSQGGCAASQDAWNNTKECTACCDTSSCSSNRFACNATCSQAMCESKERCSFGDPYMCTSGHATYGCATSSKFWPSQPTCDACCDVTSCEFQCRPCNAAECSANPCSPSNPFICTAGPLKNGCSSNPSYFGEQSQCYSCCDARHCATPAPATPTPSS